ncbi:MAG: ABC transporter ATP-binding protein, partial [Methanomassiliicoccales archaeon]
MPAIEVEGIRKSFGENRALDGLSFQVEEGTFFGCFGRNGAGKTTLLRILTGQLVPTSGEARVLGMEVGKGSREIMRSIGLVPEVESPPSYLTASEFLLFSGRLRGVEELEVKIEGWIDFFDLEEARGTLCKDLSKGMRQKVMLASAFIHQPSLLFLDEPFINLDPVYQRRLRDYLLDLRDGGRTIFMCSHILEISQKLCEEIIILDQGRLVARERADDLRRRGEDLESVFLRSVG